MMADQNEKGMDGPSIKIKKLELGGSRNSVIGDLVNSEVNLRPPNNHPGNAPKPPKPHAGLSAKTYVEIDEFHNTGTENLVMGRVEDSTLNLYDEPNGPNTQGSDTVPKVEKDQEEQSCGGKGSGGEASIDGGQPHRQERPQINIGSINIIGDGNPVVFSARGTTFNM